MLGVGTVKERLGRVCADLDLVLDLRIVELAFELPHLLYRDRLIATADRPRSGPAISSARGKGPGKPKRSAVSRAA